MSIFAFFGFGSTSTPKVPNFLLPETAEEYRRLLAEADARYNRERVRWETARTEILERARALEAQDGRNPVQEEINRRQAEELRRQADRLPWDCSVELARAGVEKSVRAGELDRIAHEGLILSSVRVDNTDASRNRFAVRERRVVECGGRHFLVLLEYREIATETGMMERRQTGDGYRGRVFENWPVLERTGEYGPPTVLWGTDALSQFTEQELRAIA